MLRIAAHLGRDAVVDGDQQAQVSGQSWGQVARTWVMDIGVYSWKNVVKPIL
jgi:hypothetical protein